MLLPCPCRAEPCGALGLTMQFTPPLHSCLVFIMTFRLSYSTTNPCVQEKRAFKTPLPTCLILSHRK